MNTQPLPISFEKKKDLMELLPSVDEHYNQDFFRNLRTKDEPAIDFDLIEIDPDIDD